MASHLYSNDIKDFNQNDNDVPNYPDMSVHNINNDNTNNNYQPADRDNEMDKDLKTRGNRQMREYSYYAYGFCAAGAIISFIIAILGILLSVKTVTTISKFLIAFGFVSMLIFLFGIWALYQYISFIDKESEENADQSSKREFLNIFIYLIIILLVVFFILAIGSLAYKKEAKSYITALGQNQFEWTKVFGNIKYTEVEKNLNAIIISVGIFAILMIGLIITILVYAYLILKSYRFIQTSVQFFCLIFFIIGALLLYCAIYADRYREITIANNSMPEWVPIALLVAAVITIIIAVGGYWAIQFESQNYTFIFGIVTAAFTCAIMVVSVYAFIFSGEFKNIFDGKCKQILDLLPEPFLVKYAGCNKKYVSTSNREPSDCPKNRILLAWDLQQIKFKEMQEAIKNNPSIQMQPIPEIYGCYDNLCCTAAYNTVSSKFNYLALIALFLIVIGVLCTLGSWKVYNDLNDGRQKSWEELNLTSSSNLVILALFGAVLIVIVIALVSLPEKPATDPNIVPVNPSDNVKIDPNTIIKPDFYKTAKNETKNMTDTIKEKTKIDEKKDCGANCPVLRYTFNLSSQDGTFVRNQSADFKNITVRQDGKDGKRYLVSFDSGPEILNSFTEYFEFVHNCPLLPASIDVKVSGEVKAKGTVFLEKKMKKTLNQISNKQTGAVGNPNIVSTVNQTNSNNSIDATVSTKVIDYSKLKIGDKFEVMNKNLDFSFVNSQQTQVIKGQVFQRIDLKTSVSLQDAQITIRSLDFGQCASYTLQSDINGNFNSPTLYNFKEGASTKFQVIVTYKDLSQYKKTVIAGGIGAQAIIDLGPIELWSPSMLESVNLNATVLDSINNKKLDGVKVSVYQGFINIDNEKTEVKTEKTTSFIQMVEKTDASLLETNQEKLNNFNVVTDASGFYQFTNIPPNLYTVVYEKEGYYREILSKFSFL